MRILVLAGYKHEADHWIRKNNWKNARYVSSHQQLYGVDPEEVEIVAADGFYRHPDFDKISQGVWHLSCMRSKPFADKVVRDL